MQQQQHQQQSHHQQQPHHHNNNNLLACQACDAPCGPGAGLPCPGCGALFFCSAAHLAAARRRLGHDAEECARMAAQLARKDAIAQHGLTQWPAQTARDVCAWLQQLHCHAAASGGGGGVLAACCPLHQAREGERPPAAGRFAALPQSGEQWLAGWAPLDAALVPPWPSAQQQQDQTQQQQREPAASWPAYYRQRGIPGSSPAALALHFPLTLFHCLASLLPEHGRQLPPRGSTIRVAYLGPQAELPLLPAFSELAALLPLHHLELHMVGPDVPDDLHGAACKAAAGPGRGSLAISCWAGCWHDLLEDWSHAREAAAAAARVPDGPAGQQGSWQPASPPDGPWHLVFAANAGLPAFPAWLPTLQRLLGGADAPSSDGGAGGSCVPVVCSDYCEEAAARSQQVAAAQLGRGLGLQPRLNPFRQPVPAAGHGTLLPACSNCFLFGWV